MTKQELERMKQELSEKMETLASDKEKALLKLGETFYNSFADTEKLEELDFGCLNGEGKADLESMLAGVRSLAAEAEEADKKMEELNAVKLCPHCGNSVGDDDLFCMVCGTRIVRVAEEEDEAVCSQCGKPRPEGAVFCRFCGFRFDAEGAALELEPEEIPAPEPEEIPAPEPVEIPAPEPEAPVKMKHCINCGKEIEADVIFCYHCGTRQP
ncbi:MAG: zinc ribbon domain-containing protein [Eubacterium sp.]|nr:zinc ribbon domain-containing protein [Eubacterium sp.]